MTNRFVTQADDAARTYAWTRCFGPGSAYAGAWFARLSTARTTRFGDSLGMEYHDYNLFHEVQSWVRVLLFSWCACGRRLGESPVVTRRDCSASLPRGRPRLSTDRDEAARAVRGTRAVSETWLC